ncbi:MAG: hypothetical protein NT003_02155 [Candidatus Magasanikbacteria bacterium]|nr:hypothetical protein [Candidatus Magasanikbacteria bacterium]
MDDVLIGPGSPTFPGGGVANLRFVSLANGQTATVTYGSGGGASGATAPITVESDTFTTKSRINDSGSLVNIATSPAVSVVAGPVSQFFLNDPGNATVGNRLGYTVTRKDQYGNLVTNGSTTVYLYSNSTGANKKFYDAASAGNIITSITIGNGSSSANFWYYDETPGNWTITTSDNASAPDGATGVADATDAVTYAAGSVSQFSLNDPGDTTAGTRLGYTVTRKDSFGNLVTSGANTIYLYSSSAGVNKKFYDASSAGNIITSVTIGNGSSSANFWTYDELSGTFTISASDNSSSPDGVTGIVDATDSVVISADATSQFTLNDPGNFAAGSRIGYTVTRKDQFNNLVTLGSNTVYLYSNSTGANKKFYDAAIAGNVITSIAIGNGSSSANFWYFDDKAGTWTITASDNSSVPDGATGISDATDSITINISATRFVILNPTDATAGDNVAVTVQAQDAEGNVDTGYQNDVTLVASGSATGAGVIDIVNGVGTKVISDTVAETVNLSLSDSQSTGLNVGSTQDVIFAAGPTAQFLINDPGNTIAGNRIGYIVTRKDQYGNPVTSGSNTVYLYSSSTGANKKFYDAATSGTVVTSVVIGSTTSTAQFWYYDEIPGTYTITASDNSSAPDGAAGIADATDSITILEGAVSQFTLSNPGDMTAGTRLPFSVTRRDQLGNPIITGSDVVYLYSNSTGANKKFYDAASGGNVITSISIDAATSSAQFWYYDETPGSWTITASDSASAPDGAVGIADAAQSTLVNSGTATQFTLNSPANIAAGNRGAYTVIRKDQFGNLATAGSTTVYLYSNSTGANKKFYDAASGGADITSITIGSGNSSADFWYYDELAGSWAITASDSATSPDGATGIADATDNLLVSTGSTAQYLITHPATMIAGNRLGHTVTRKDQYGNEVTTGTNTVYLYSDSTGANKRFYDASSAGNVVTSVVIGATSSTANFWYYDDAAGNWTVTVSDNSSAPDGATGIQDASNSIAVAPAATAQFILNDPGDMVTSTRIGYTVTRKDQFGNEVVTGSDTAYLYSSSTGSNKAFYDAAINNNTITSVAFGATSSTAHFWYYDEAVGTWTITASDNSSAPNGTTGIDDGTDSLTVSDTPVVATRFIILPPTNGTVGDHKTITIEAQDESGRVDTAYTHDVTLQTNGAATGAGVVDIVNGVGTISITDTVAQTVDLSLLDSQATGLIFSSTQQITFAPGAVSQFVLSNPGGITAGTRAAYTVTRKDQYGNDVVVGSDTVYLYTNSSNSLGKFYGAAIDASVLTSINIAPGNANASFWYYDETSGNWQITASDNATSPDDVVGISDDTDLIVVTPGSTAQFTINNPGSMTAGTRLGYAATRKDQFGNLVTTGTDTVYVYSSSTGSQAKFYSAASGGSVITSFIITTGHSSGDFWYYDELPGTWAITASDNLFAPDDLTGIDDAVDNVTVSAAPIVATRFVILDPADTTAGGSSTVTIEAQDDAGNIDTTYQSDVTLVTDGSATGAGLVNIVNGVGTKTITDAAGETITLSLVDIQSTGLDVSSVQDLLFATLPIAQLSSLGVEVYAAPNTLRIAGQAYPGASVTLIEKNAPGDVIVKRSIAAASGNFEITSSAYQSGEHLFALLIKDKDGRSAQTRGFLANFTLGTLDVMNLIIPPTTALTRSTVTRGDFIKVIGYAAPQVGIQIELDHDILYETTSNDRGAYELLINTARFEPGMHSVRARQLSAFTNRPSEYSLSKNFNVSTLTVPKADLNNDGTIDIRDSSIFLELYRQKNKKADLNNDGKVDVSDLSIFLRAFNK